MDAKETLFLRVNAVTVGLSNTFIGRGNVLDLPASSVSYTGDASSSGHICVDVESSLSVVVCGTVISSEGLVGGSVGGGGRGGARRFGVVVGSAMASKSSIALPRCVTLLHVGCADIPNTVDRAPLVSTWFVTDRSNHVRNKSSTVG